MACKPASWPYNELISTPILSKHNCPIIPANSDIQSTLSHTIDTVARKPQSSELTATHSLLEPSPPQTCNCPGSPRVGPMAPTLSSDTGFAYVNRDDRLPHVLLRDIPQTSRLGVEAPGNLDPLSPTFREELTLHKREKLTEKEQAKDLKVKTKVRMAKFFLRGVSFGCSLIVLTMVSTSFSIFHATKNLPPRNHLPAWAAGTKTWPQTFVLVIASISLFFSLAVFWNYYRGGHRKAEKVAVYYTLFAVALFIFSSIIWGVAAGILQGSRSNGNNRDLWGWSCVDNKRRKLFSDKVNYALVCRMQNWALVCCIIEIVLESITILLYAVVFYRFYTKERLRKSMIDRDRARTDLYSARLQSQSALLPTSGFGPHLLAVGKKPFLDLSTPDTRSHHARPEVEKLPNSAIYAKPFHLQPPPPRKTPLTTLKSPIEADSGVQVVQRFTAAPGEPQYEKVPIPSAYL